VVLTPLNKAVPPDVAKLYEAKKKAIVAGTLIPFSGPMKDNKGVQKLAPGVAMPLGDLMAINWYVDGVEGSIPK
jgi:nucleoside-binding protein